MAGGGAGGAGGARVARGPALGTRPPARARDAWAAGRERRVHAASTLKLAPFSDFFVKYFEGRGSTLKFLCWDREIFSR